MMDLTWKWEAIRQGYTRGRRGKFQGAARKSSGDIIIL